MSRWYAALLAVYLVILFRAYADCKKIWRRAALLRAVMGRK